MNFYLFQQINQFAGQNPYLDIIAIFFAKYFGYFLIGFLFILLYKNFNKYLRMTISAISAAFLSRLFFTELIRFIVPRQRPYVENNVNLLLSHISQPAFPSGHAAFFFALSTVVYLYNVKKYPHLRFFNVSIGLWFFTASFIICLARVFCGIHWPLDILAGAIVGIFSGILIYKIFAKQ